MKTLIDFLNETEASIKEYYELIDEINAEMIYESFQSSIIKDICDTMTKARNDYDDYEALGDAKYSLKRNSKWSTKLQPPTFKEVFMNGRIKWDTIKDEDFKECSKNNKEDIALAKKICSNRSNSITGILFICNESDVQEYKQFKFTGAIFKTISWQKPYYQSFTDRFKSVEVKPSEAEDYLSEKFYILEIPEEKVNEYEKQRQERNIAKTGMIIPGNKQQYKEIADRNRERFRKLAEKRRMEKNAKDGISESITEIMGKIFEIAKEFSSNPIKYSKFNYDLCYLLDLTSDKQHTYYQGSKSRVSGINGLMFLYKRYLDTKLDLASGNSYGYQSKEFDSIKQNINKILQQIKEKIKSLEEKMASI
jgi:hypothetical protein